MPARNHDLHGNVPDECEVALLVIDMINDLEFEGGERLLKPAVRAAERIAALKKRARALGVPVVYANDNFRRWRSDFTQVVDHCLYDGVRGQPLAEMLKPDSDDYFVLKPKHSAFFATTLQTLLEYLHVQRLIITGISGESCVLATALDAYMRDIELYVPSDCTASSVAANNRAALEWIERLLHADMRSSDELDLKTLAGRRKRQVKRKGGRA
jgi:nicotinamidase-related amidase